MEKEEWINSWKWTLVEVWFLWKKKEEESELKGRGVLEVSVMEFMGGNPYFRKVNNVKENENRDNITGPGKVTSERWDLKDWWGWEPQLRGSEVQIRGYLWKTGTDSQKED